MFKVTAFLFLLSSGAFAYVDPTSAPMTAELLKKKIEAAKVTTLDQVPTILPEEFRLNFVLKHGIKRSGERGHLVEEKVSQSADPGLPRAMIWDERNGFTVSYNGAGAGQTGGQRLDVMSFDAAKKLFVLREINFPLARGKVKYEMSNCLTCHGPQGRPIFAMYPDWPSFYGSDNDELLSDSVVQKAEHSDYIAFTRAAGATHPRYSPLFNESMIKQRLGLDVYPTYPFRYELKLEVDDASRAFAWRPGLRVGIVYNRLMSQHVVQKIKSHKNFAKMGKFLLYNLLQCGTYEKDKVKGSGRINRALKELSALGGTANLKTTQLMDYRSMWKMFDLGINDVDIRYSYNHEGYKSNDATENLMAVGYIGEFFNSYFDGSATIDELVAAQLYSYYQERHPGLKNLITLRGLTSKYGRFEKRMKHDAGFFKEMDKQSLWVPIPYPKILSSVHHRETYQDAYQNDHTTLCSTMGEMMWWPTKP